MSEDRNTYWFLGLACQKNKESEIRNQIKSHILNHNLASYISFLELPQNFKYGSFGDLMTIINTANKTSAELAKILLSFDKYNTEILKDHNENMDPLLAKKKMIEPIIESFSWNNVMYSSDKSLLAISDTITNVAKEQNKSVRLYYEEYIKKRDQMSELKSESLNFTSIDFNSILTSDIVPKNDFIYTEYMETVLVVVPMDSIETWKSSFYKLHQAIFPQITNQLPIQDSKNNCLFTMIILKKKFDEIYSSCYNKGYIVKKYQFDMSKCNSISLNQEQLYLDLNILEKKVLHALDTAYKIVYTGLLHVKFIHLITECLLRYVNDYKFITVLVKPKRKKGKELYEYLFNKKELDNDYYQIDVKIAKNQRKFDAFDLDLSNDDAIMNSKYVCLTFDSMNFTGPPLSYNINKILFK